MFLQSVYHLYPFMPSTSWGEEGPSKGTTGPSFWCNNSRYLQINSMIYSKQVKCQALQITLWIKSHSQPAPTQLPQNSPANPHLFPLLFHLRPPLHLKRPTILTALTKHLPGEGGVLKKSGHGWTNPNTWFSNHQPDQVEKYSYTTVATVIQIWTRNSVPLKSPAVSVTLPSHLPLIPPPHRLHRHPPDGSVTSDKCGLQMWLPKTGLTCDLYLVTSLACQPSRHLLFTNWSTRIVPAAKWSTF